MQLQRNTEQLLLYQILHDVRDLQKDMDVLLQEGGSEDLEEIDSEDLEESDLEGQVADLQRFEEKEDGLLRNIERNCKTLREKTDAIVDTTSAAKDAVVGVFQVFGIVASVGAILAFVFPKLI